MNSSSVVCCHSSLLLPKSLRRNPDSDVRDSVFFYVISDDKNENGILKPKHPYTLRKLENMMITDGNLELIDYPLDNTEREKMTHLLLIPELPPNERLTAAIVDSLYQLRSSPVRYFLWIAVQDLFQQERTAKATLV